MQVRLTCTWPKVDWLGCATVAEVSDINHLVCRNAVPKVFGNPCLFFRHLCHVTVSLSLYSNQSPKMGIMLIQLLCVCLALIMADQE